VEIAATRRSETGSAWRALSSFDQVLHSLKVCATPGLIGTRAVATPTVIEAMRK
jgi:hypothetical protein